jgi:hypothetical protein
LEWHTVSILYRRIHVLIKVYNCSSCRCRLNAVQCRKITVRSTEFKIQQQQVLIQTDKFF